MTEKLPDRTARLEALETNLKPFTARTEELLRSYGAKASKSDLAKILIIECFEAGYMTEAWILTVARGLPLSNHDVSIVLHDTSAPDCPWELDDQDRFRLRRTE